MENILVINKNDYVLAEDQIDAIASEWDGLVLDMIGGIDDIHIEFSKRSYADSFYKCLEAYKIHGH